MDQCPKVQDHDKIMILSTSTVRKEIFKSRDGELVSKILPSKTPRGAHHQQIELNSPIASSHDTYMFANAGVDPERAKQSIKTRVNNITFDDADFQRLQKEKNELMNEII